jgi:hypothetical protein
MLEQMELLSAENTEDNQALVNRMRERTFTPELRSLVSKVTLGNKAVLGVSANELLKGFHRLFYRVKNIPWRVQRIHSGVNNESVPVCGDSAGRIIEKTKLFVRAASESGADRLIVAGIDKAGMTENEIVRSRFILSLVYSRLRKEFRGRAFFIRFRPDYFSLLIRHEHIKALRNSLDKPDFCAGMFYKQEIVFENYSLLNSEILKIAL